MKFLWIICRFVVAEDKLRMSTVAEGSSEFLCSGSRQGIIFYFVFDFLFVYLTDHK